MNNNKKIIQNSIEKVYKTTIKSDNNIEIREIKEENKDINQISCEPGFGLGESSIFDLKEDNSSDKSKNN